DRAAGPGRRQLHGAGLARAPAVPRDAALRDHPGRRVLPASRHPGPAPRRRRRGLTGSHYTPTGVVQLSRREREVAALIAEGLTNRDIGHRLFISERTVEGHVEHILDKLGYQRRSQIAVWTREDDRFQHPGNLPSRLTTFVGRQHELGELRALLGEARLVSIVGPGGIGKTRLG